MVKLLLPGYACWFKICRGHIPEDDGQDLPGSGREECGGQRGQLIVKSEAEDKHQLDLEETFNTIRKYDLKLNPEKCSFGIQVGKFLSFMLTNRGIEVNPEKCKAIIDMCNPKNAKDVQKLIDESLHSLVFCHDR